jgi:hypothetical protein
MMNFKILPAAIEQSIVQQAATNIFFKGHP